MPLIVFAVPFVAGKQRPRVLRSGRTYTPKQTREATAKQRNDVTGLYS